MALRHRVKRRRVKQQCALASVNTAELSRKQKMDLIIKLGEKIRDKADMRQVTRKLTSIKTDVLNLASDYDIARFKRTQRKKRRQCRS